MKEDEMATYLRNFISIAHLIFLWISYDFFQNSKISSLIVTLYIFHLLSRIYQNNEPLAYQNLLLKI